MPSPVSHSLIGLAIGMARFLPRVPDWRQLTRQIWKNRGPLFICILLANAPDLDYLFGIPIGNMNMYHQTITHTIIWVMALSLAVWACGWPNRSIRSLLFILVLIGNHLVIDFFTQDNSKPYGMMLAWPFSTRYWQSSLSVFPAAMRRSMIELWTFHNVKIVILEILITLPLVAAVAAFKIRTRQK